LLEEKRDFDAQVLIPSLRDPFLLDWFCAYQLTSEMRVIISMEFRRKIMFNHIAYNPEVLSGKPHIIGTRLSIEFILELFASGATRDEVLKAYPQLTADAVEEALKYAAQSVKNEVLLDVKVGA